MLELDTLIDRCRQGDELAWEAVVRRYQGRVLGVALHYVRDREEARDVAQETFVKLYRNLARLEAGTTFLPWLLRIARNSAIDRLRRNAARRPPAEAPEEDAAATPDPGPSAEEALFQDARRALVYRALGALSERNREMILLKDIQQLRLEEVAEILDLPLGTVKSRTNRARLQLAQAVRRLDPSYGADP